MKAIKSTLAQSGVALYIKALIFGLLAGCAGTAVLLCISTLVLLVMGTLPHNFIEWIIIGLCCISAFVCGYITARVTKANGLLWGAVSGVLMFIIVLLAGLISSDGNFTYMTILKFACLTVCGGLGGIKGVNRKEKLHIK
ncbi:MAG: TIGR04086 family membrane protein [Ruminococcus sp.]|nr:TIGR04086 family membrane protein [Ruminococcus sp.]